MSKDPICVYFPFASVYLFRDRTLVELIMLPRYWITSSQFEDTHPGDKIKKTKTRMYDYVKSIILTKAYDSTILFHARNRTL
jgi:hypothetical protein